MVNRGLQSFQSKKILFLQGPVGPFFRNLAWDLQNAGASVYKINFNGGDWFFSPKGSVNYRGSASNWGDFFSDFLAKHHIDTVILFGDCRDYHRIAHGICDQLGVEIGVFEEGYIRPDYITFEDFGVNGYSLISRDTTFYRTLEPAAFTRPKSTPIGNTFWYAAWWAFLYYLFSALFVLFFRRYQHHRSLSPWEITYWIRSIWRKQWYKIKEAGIGQKAVTTLSKNYFLVPLQISTDAQVRDHSEFSSVEHFIERVMSSFSAHASPEVSLLIKHHPLDRGYHDYEQFIKRLAHHHNISERVYYIHDQHLPTLLDHAQGVVVINSTVGLSAVHHNTPLKVCGLAVYDMEGMTYQKSLDSFWKNAKEFTVDDDLYNRFRGYVINQKQINGSFYRKLEKSLLRSGVLWS